MGDDCTGVGDTDGVPSSSASKSSSYSSTDAGAYRVGAEACVSCEVDASGKGGGVPREAPQPIDGKTVGARRDSPLQSSICDRSSGGADIHGSWYCTCTRVLVHLSKSHDFAKVERVVSLFSRARSCHFTMYIHAPGVLASRGLMSSPWSAYRPGIARADHLSFAPGRGEEEEPRGDGGVKSRAVAAACEKPRRRLSSFAQRAAGPHPPDYSEHRVDALGQAGHGAAEKILEIHPVGGTTGEYRRNTSNKPYLQRAPIRFLTVTKCDLIMLLFYLNLVIEYTLKYYNLNVSNM